MNHHPTRPDAAYWIEKIDLTPHVEGGYFKETYRSEGCIPAENLPAGYNGARSYSTGIYFLLEKGRFSAFHRIQSDEVWHFYFGDTLHVYEIDSEGSLIIHRLGPDPTRGETFQAIVRAGHWFASSPAPGSEYSLVGCTVAPGFEYQDFELATKSQLLKEYPMHHEWIEAFTRQ